MATMQFVDSLPVGLENVQWQIVAPIGGMKDRLEAVERGEELYIDLMIKRDERQREYQAFIRVIPDLITGIQPDDLRDRVYHLNDARAFFLDIDGQMTETLVKLRVVLSTEATPPDLSAGFVVMWQNNEGHIATAS